MRRSASLAEAARSSCFGFISVSPAAQKVAVISVSKRDKAVLMFPALAVLHLLLRRNVLLLCNKGPLLTPPPSSPLVLQLINGAAC